MTINIFGYTLTLKKDVVKKVKGGTAHMLQFGPKIAQYEGTLYLCDEEGYIIPKQLDIVIEAPLNGPVTATVQFFISGITQEPKFRPRTVTPTI